MDSEKNNIWNYAIPNEIAGTSIKQNWSKAWESSYLKAVVLVTVVTCLAVMLFLPYYFSYIQARAGIYIYDPILAVLKPTDVSLLTFSLLYICVTICVSYIAHFPRFLLKGAWAYCILTCLRMFVMLFVPLEAPPEIIVLVDPILSLIVYQETTVTKDLFFSGHTATMALLAFGVPNKVLKSMFIFGIFVMAALLLKQHVHYTVDILVAPFFAYVSWKLAEKIEEKVFGKVSTVETEY